MALGGYRGRAAVADGFGPDSLTEAVMIIRSSAPALLPERCSGVYIGRERNNDCNRHGDALIGE